MGLRSTMIKAGKSGLTALSDLQVDVTVDFLLTGKLVDPVNLQPIAATVGTITVNMNQVYYNISVIGAEVTTDAQAVKMWVVKDPETVLSQRLTDVSLQDQLMKLGREIKLIMRQDAVTRTPLLYDYLTYDGLEWWIQDIERDPLDITYKFEAGKK